jgi:hypothetical protein
MSTKLLDDFRRSHLGAIALELPNWAANVAMGLD